MKLSVIITAAVATATAGLGVAGGAVAITHSSTPALPEQASVETEAPENASTEAAINNGHGWDQALAHAGSHANEHAAFLRETAPGVAEPEATEDHSQAGEVTPEVGELPSPAESAKSEHPSAH